MTIYMPTILLNIIGHSTNYFKPFFFEAVVTVNLTVSHQMLSVITYSHSPGPQVMLVLTTMFVGVSQSLPKTSSIKMVDYWLVFNLMIPFIEVLIHTYEDTLRTDEQEVNHHGRTVSVGGEKDKKDVKIAFNDSKFKDVSGNEYDKKLFSVNEEVQVCISTFNFKSFH